MEKKIKVYKSNVALSFGEFVYLIKLNYNQSGEHCDYLVIHRHNISDDFLYPVGTIINGLEDYYVEVTDAMNVYISQLYKDSEYLFNYFIENCDTLEIIEKDEETLPVTLGMIKAICGWSEYCDVTGGNHYMLNEHNVSDSEVFDVKRSHAKELGLIK